MVNVIKDERKWIIHITLYHSDCPYLYFPANYHGCEWLEKYRNIEGAECNKDTCPFILKNET